jgi:hypothetical protein
MSGVRNTHPLLSGAVGEINFIFKERKKERKKKTALLYTPTEARALEDRCSEAAV